MGLMETYILRPILRPKDSQNLGIDKFLMKSKIHLILLRVTIYHNYRKKMIPPKNVKHPRKMYDIIT